MLNKFRRFELEVKSAPKGARYRGVDADLPNLLSLGDKFTAFCYTAPKDTGQMTIKIENIKSVVSGVHTLKFHDPFWVMEYRVMEGATQGIYPLLLELTEKGSAPNICAHCYGDGFTTRPYQPYVPAPPKKDKKPVVIDVDATQTGDNPSKTATDFILAGKTAIRKVFNQGAPHVVDEIVPQEKRKGPTNGKFPYIDQVCIHNCLDLLWNTPANPNPNAPIALGFNFVAGSMGYRGQNKRITPWCRNITILEKFVEANVLTFLQEKRGVAPNIPSWQSAN